MANARQSSGSRAAYESWHATGTAPAAAAVITFTTDAGESVTTLEVGHASQISIKATNADVADDLVLSYRIKLHPSEAAFTEASTTTTQESTTEILTPYVIGDKLLAGVQLQVWWHNETGVGTTATIVTVSVK